MWRFGYLMELLPVMLQAALFLLCLALSLYLWGINTTAAYVVIGITLLGTVSYLTIVGAAAAFGSCPYQTPGSRFTRSLCGVAASITRRVVKFIYTFVVVFARFLRRYWMTHLRPREKLPFDQSLKVLLAQYFLIAVETTDALGTSPGLISITSRWVYLWRAPASTERGLDLRCVSWMIEGSFDKVAHTSTLKYLQTITTSPYFEPTTITSCFKAFIGCIVVSGGNVTIVQESEELAILSATCFLRALFCHSTSPVYAYRPALEEVRQRYIQTFPHPPDFGTLPVCYTMAIIHYRLANQRRRKLSWRDCGSTSRDHPFVAQTLAEFARPPKQRGRPKVPRWILRFALHSLSLDPLPPTSVIADCLSIVATDLGCSGIPNTGTTSDERCVCI